ncbi:diacylglycerol/lipid kinase family protein [Fulvivirga sedimenti]|uniref:DAGKc domain-containing protein n=1 Tax=Fulvivirga sedimenti TaxID=2879465 RepID=A0A9X1KZ30_9BACT|nr:diacylglycerol kinase family protein [Fulvivirga sedimenti]MCA6078498.1 hypothetical protein [Fulvivirga sedimenti]
MPTKVFFLINPISGGLDKKGFRSNAEQFCKTHNLSPKFLETTGKDDPSRLAESLKEYQPEILVIGGGDGTVNLAASTLQEIAMQIPIAIIPLGSANGMARELLIPEEPLEALKLILNSNQKNVDVLVVNGQYSIHLSDLGFNAKLIRKFEKFGQRGKWNYARHFFSILQEQSTSEYSIYINDEVIDIKAHMVAFANARTYGTGAVINPDGKLDDGIFEVCIFRPYPWYALGGIAWKFFIGDIKESPYVKIIPAREALVLVHPDEELQIDGEVIGTVAKVEVSVSEMPLNVLVP